MPSSKGRILCVDDNTDARELVRMLLVTSGYEIKCVENPFEALELVQSEKFDLIILDTWMPKLIGTELARLIRGFDQTTPILFYSAAAYEADKHAAFEAGATAYLTKPTGFDDLANEVEKLICQDDR